MIVIFAVLFTGVAILGYAFTTGKTYKTGNATKQLPGVIILMPYYICVLSP